MNTIAAATTAAAAIPAQRQGEDDGELARLDEWITVLTARRDRLADLYRPPAGRAMRVRYPALDDLLAYRATLLAGTPVQFPVPDAVDAFWENDLHWRDAPYSWGGCQGIARTAED